MRQEDKNGFFQIRVIHVIGLLLLLGAFITIWTILPSPVQGVADNGDFLRVMYRFGLNHKTPMEAYHGWHYLYVDRIYGMKPPPAGESDTTLYASSDLVLVWLAVNVRRIFAGADFDIRWIGIFHGAAYLVAMAIFVLAFPMATLKRQLLMTGCCLLILLDASYVSFANSFYSEPAFFIGYLAFVGLGIHVMRRGQLDLPFLAYITIAGLVASTSKTQTASLAPLLAVGTVLLAAKFSRERLVRLAAVCCAAGHLLGPVVCVKLSPAKFRMANQFNIVFLDILNHSGDPGQALTDLGLGRDLLKYQNGNVWGIDVVNPELAEKFYKPISWFKIAGYYLTHPLYSAKLGFIALTDGFTITLPYPGHHEEGTGYPPRSHATGLVLWTLIRDVFSPMGFVIIPVFFGWSLLTSWKQPPSSRNWMIAASCWQIAAACTQLASAVMGEGRTDITKHMLPFNFCFDVLLLWLLYCLLQVQVKGDPYSRVLAEVYLAVETPVQEEREAGETEKLDRNQGRSPVGTHLGKANR